MKLKDFNKNNNNNINIKSNTTPFNKENSFFSKLLFVCPFIKCLYFFIK